MIFVVIIVIFSDQIPMPNYLENDGVLEDWRPSTEVIFESRQLTLLLIGIMISNAI